MVFCMSNISKIPPSSQIKTINSIKELNAYLKQIDKNTLVLFDIDSTLTTPSDPYWQRQTIQRHSHIYKRYTSSLTENEFRIFNHLVVFQSLSQLVEPHWTEIIQDFSKRKIPTLAFTASSMGSIGTTIPSFACWRYHELKRLGIDFSATFPNTKIFEELEDLDNGHPGIERGIIYVGYKIKKGELLTHIFKALEKTPTQIVVIDDKLENIISCKENIELYFPNVSFLGFHYKGVNFLPPTETRADEFKTNMEKVVQQTKIICST